jgi:hypothetical protein
MDSYFRSLIVLFTLSMPAKALPQSSPSLEPYNCNSLIVSFVSKTFARALPASGPTQLVLRLQNGEIGEGKNS